VAIPIKIEGFAEPPKPEVVQGLVGQVVDVLVGGTIEPEGTLFGEFFRFARVLEVRQRKPSLDTPVCERCQETAAQDIHVEWESEYFSPDGDVLCENCLCLGGIVVQGAAAITFGSEDHPDEEHSISSVTRLVELGPSDA
jgi:hypothetical protein